MKYFLMIVGAVAIILFVYLLIVGVKVVSEIFFYIIGALAIISIIGYLIYFIGKMVGKKSK